MELDYSRDSVKELDEKILDPLHQQREAGDLDDQEFSRNSIVCGPRSAPS